MAFSMLISYLSKPCLSSATNAQGSNCPYSWCPLLAAAMPSGHQSQGTGQVSVENDLFLSQNLTLYLCSCLLTKISISASERPVWKHSNALSCILEEF